MADTLSTGHEEIVDLIDIEECGKAERKPPKARHYRIRIDKDRYTVDVPSMTGQTLVLAGKSPPERWTISQKFHGGRTQEIGLEEVVDFTEPGVERLMTLPLDQTEG